MSDWWSKKIAGEKPAPTRTTTTPPTTPPLRFPAPQQQTAPQVHQTSHNQNVLDPNRAPTEQISMGEALRLWKGGEAARKEGDATCPECGSIYVFSRVGRGSNSMINGAQPAPRCYSCGWNGRYSQADQTNWGV